MTATASNQLPFRLSHRAGTGDVSALDAWWRWLNQPLSSPRSTARGRVLLISYQFPPTGGSGVQRPSKLAKYLPRCGWSVEVLTAAHDRFPWTDPSLLTDVPSHLAIHRVAGREPACVARWLAASCARIGGERLGRRVGDALHWRLTGWADRLGLSSGESLWVGPASRTAIRLVGETPFDAVISTGPPHFAHRVAMRVARASNLPWIADLRDPLVSDFDRAGQSPRHTRQMRELEAAIVEQASRVVTTCPSFAWDLRDRYPDRAADIGAITNGFDRDDLLAAIGPQLAQNRSASECLFVAAGAFYGRRELTRIIRPLERIIQLHPHWRGRVKLVIAGTIDAEQRRMMESECPEWVSCTGYVDHAAAVRLVAQAACGIVVVPNCEHGRLSIPGKTFELLALPAHVLALVPPGSDTEQIVRRAGGSSVACFESEHAVAAAMRGIIQSHFEGRLDMSRDWHRVDAFDRQVVAMRFAERLDAVCGRTSLPQSLSPEESKAAEVA